MNIEKEQKKTKLKSWMLLGILISLTICTTWYMAWLGKMIFKGLTG